MRKKAIAGGLALSLLINHFIPYTVVMASTGYTLHFRTNKDYVLEEQDGKHLVINGQYVDLKNSNEETIGEVSCESDKHCQITVSDGTSGHLNYHSDTFSLTINGELFEMERVFNNSEDIEVEDYREDNRDHHFNGKAYLIWSCKKGGVCYHFFEDIPVNENGTSVFYKESEIKDDETNEQFDVHAEYKGWYLEDTLNEWITTYMEVKKLDTLDPIKVDPKDIVGDPIDMRSFEEQADKEGKCNKNSMSQDEFMACIDDYAHSLGYVWTNKLQPLPDEPYDNNAYVSYGDRNFKVVIYNDEYKGVSIGDLSDLHYYPASWNNPFIRQDQFDISGTSKQNPTIINTVLLESTINIKTLNYNSYGIKSIEALDVPSNAVTVTKTNSEWKIKFSSNFYDKVVFKVTDTKNNTEYFQINRNTVDAWLGFYDNKPTIRCDFYYENSKSYTNYQINAKIIYKDGTTKNIDMKPVYGVDDGLGNITYTYEYNEEEAGGMGLKRTTYEYSLGNNPGVEETISKVIINVEKEGSTEKTYAGAFAGSNKGIVLDFEEER